jgi:hypothetical protein
LRKKVSKILAQRVTICARIAFLDQIVRQRVALS